MHRILAALLCLAPFARGQDVLVYAMGLNRPEIGAMLEGRGFFGKLGFTYATYRTDVEEGDTFSTDRETVARSGARAGLGIIRGWKGIDFGIDGYTAYERLFQLRESDGGGDRMTEGGAVSLGIEGSASIAFLERFRVGAFFNLFERRSEEISYPGYSFPGEGLSRQTGRATSLSSDIIPAVFLAVRL